MKSFARGTLHLLTLFIAVTGTAQTITNVLPVTISNAAAPGPWEAKALDGLSTEWTRTVMVSNAHTGELEPSVERYVALASGLNYLDASGTWQAAADQIDVLTNGMGGAGALRGQTKAYFPTTLGDAASGVTLISEKGTVLKIAPLAVYYVDDSTGESVLLAQMKPGVQGELVGYNQVVYRNAMQGGLNCDIRFTYTRGACEADLIINSQPIAPPENYSLDPTSTRLELVSAVTGSLPSVTPISAAGDLPDFALAYDGGGLQFVQGYAFSVAGDPMDSSATPADAPAQVILPTAATGDDRVPVAKEFIQMPTPGQWGLGERVKWKDIEPKLQALPPYQQQGALSTPQKHASAQREWPVLTEHKAEDPKPMKVATAAYRPKGVLWDWTTVNSGTTYWFSNSVTYYVAGLCSFTANVTFDPGCTIKFTNGASLYLTGPVTCNGTTANPSVLTSLSDWGFGVRVPGGTGYQTYSAAQAIWLNYTNSTQVLNGLRFRWAQTGLYLSGPSGGGLTHNVTNCVFEWCQTGIFSTNCTAAIANSTKCTLGTDVSGSHTGSLTDVCNGTDSNGLTYSWEHEYFGTNSVSTTADPDGDGLSNQQEFNDGTSPLASDLPQILEQPANQLVAKGYPATFSVYGVGTGTLTYQWLYNGQSLVSATNSSYTISSVQLTNTGNYSVWLTNTCGTNATRLTSLSSNAFLSVAVSTNTAIPAQQGIISWWKGENNALDSAGTNHGTASGAVGYSAGKVGQAFNFTNGLTGTVTVSNSSSLNFNINADFSIEGWIQAQTATNNTYGVQSILDKRYAPDTSDSVGYAFYLVNGVLGCQLAQNPLTSGGYANYGPAGPDLRGAFHHIAMTVSRVNPSGGALYVDGTNCLTFNPTIEPGDLTTTNSLLIGKHATPGLNCYFGGLIDELAIYNRALSTSDIQSLYTNGSAGKYLPPSAPVITNQPQSLSLGPLASATFSVGASGTTPFSYQWLFNGGAISGATASSYTISSCGFMNAGTYAVIVANSGGSVVSSNATLTVTNATTPAGLVAWWRAEGDARDAIGGNDGKLVGTSFASGEVGQAFNNQYGYYVKVPSSPALKLTNAFTVEFWYKDTGSEWYQVGLLGKCSPILANFDIVLWATNSLSMGFWDPTVSSVPQSLGITPVPQANVLHHIAGTYQQVGTNVQMKLYVDGTMKASASVAGNLANTVNDAPLAIGTTVPTSSFFTGLIDELSIYTNVLTATQISAIYNAGPAGKTLPPNTAPSMLLQPTNQTTSAGMDVLLSAQAIGSAPLTYQWKLNGVSISGATNRVYITNNVQPGTYTNTVVINNSFGSVTSLMAVLTVTSAPPCITAPSNIVGWWKADGTARDEIGDDAGVLMSGVSYTNGMVNQGFNVPGYPVQSFVSIASSPALKFTNAFTIEFWYKDPNGGGGSYALLSKEQVWGSCSSPYPAGNYLVAMAGADFYFQCALSDPNSGSVGLAYWPVAVGQMLHHLAASYQQTGTNIAITFYIDGKPVLTNTVPGILSNCISDTPLTVGAYNAAGSGSFPGTIDEVAIYSRALAASEIASIYNAGSKGKCLTSTAPAITTQPAGQSVGAGSEVVMTVYATGTPQLTYQWQYDSAAIAGATNKSYIINNAQAAQAGTYTVLVTNALGSVLSQPALLSITNPPACTPPPPNMVSWWRAEGDATDSVGSNNGIMTNGAGFGIGKVNQGFSFNGTGYVQIADSPSLHFTNALTVEFWYKDTGSASICGLISKASTSSPSGTFAVALVPNATLDVYFGDATFGGQWLAQAPAPTAGAFHHVAVTYLQNGLNQVSVGLYIDGQCARPGTFVGNLTNSFSSAPMVIGAFDTLGDWPLKGIVDEVSLYNRVLSAGEIQAIYNAGASGKCFNDMPYVTITTPTNYQSFTQLATVGITATAYDENAVVTNIQFWAGTNFIGTAVSNPTSWTLNWTGKTNGYYGITAMATDSKGASNSSSMVVFQVNATHTPPTVNITSPTNGAVFPACSGFTIAATASDQAGSVTNVQFFVNGALIGNDTTNPYSIAQANCQSGAYVLTAIASDNLGAQGISAAISITVISNFPTSGAGFWDPNFGNPGAQQDEESEVDAVLGLAVSGSDLYVLGDFYSVGGLVPTGPVVHWDGTNWLSMGTNLSLPDDYCPSSIAIDGTNLYVGDRLGGYLHKWNGSDWDEVGDQVSGPIYAIATVGSDLYIGGNFFSLSGAQYLAKLAGSTWAAVGSNTLNAPVYAIASIANNLYIGGDFTSADGATTNSSFIAQFNGNSWTNLGTGVWRSDGSNGTVRALAASGSSLFVGGNFTVAGGNTNANAIAKWDQTKWTTLGSGLIGGTADGSSEGPLSPDNSLTPSVDAIALRCNQVFVGGEFTSAANSSNVMNYVARATWNEALQTWSWSDLDQGVSGYGQGDHVFALALMQTSTNAYDLFVGGAFTNAGSGQLISQHIARWSVGRPYPPLAPTVTITAPTNYTLFTNPSSITNKATVTTSTNITQLDFYLDGAWLDTETHDTNAPYQFIWTSPSQGAHLLTAVVTDTNGIKGESPPVIFSVNSSTNTVTAVDDSFVLQAGRPSTSLSVLANDIPATGLRVSCVMQQHDTVGTATVSFDGSGIVYTPNAHVYGTDIFPYAVTNGSGIASTGYVSVTIRTPPVVQINSPSDGTQTTAPANLSISGTSWCYDGVVTNVTLYVNGTNQVGSTTSQSFSFNWTNSSPGFYTFIATATNNSGYTAASAPVTLQVTATNGLLPVANIYSASTPGIYTNNASITGALLVTNGQLTVTGDAYDTDGEAVSWQFVLMDPSRPGSAPLYNVTPGPLNSQGFHTGSVTNAAFPTFDLSLVQNGCYQLTLNVRAGGDQATDTLLIGVASNLKIGQFSFSEQDLSIPVNGIPITVVRTYNSLNPISSDFGYGWSFAINSMDVQLDETRGNVSLNSLQVVDADVPIDPDQVGPMVSIRTGGGHDVSLTLPDGRRTTFTFAPFISGKYATASWTNAPDVHATLAVYPSYSASINLFPEVYWVDGTNLFAPSDFDHHDVPGWVLQTSDGTQYYITRGQPGDITLDTTGTGHYLTARTYGPPVLSSIVQRTGDKLVINSSGIQHYATNNPTTPTRSIYFDRDIQGRIVGLHDPISGSNGPPIVQYVYNQDTGNLIQVIKLLDRNALTYSTNKYWYANSAFPHYITSTENGLGVPIARNNYDSNGRLISTTDANGNTTQFVHNLTNNQELIVDRLGHTNTYTYDASGNVLSVTNALGGITTNAYDAFNNKIAAVAFLTNSPYATTTYSYDSAGSVLSTTNPLGFVTAYAYNQFEQVTNVVDARNASTTNYYDSNGNLVGTSDALGNTNGNFFDGNGLLVGAVDPLGTVTTNRYDNFGNLTNTATLSSSGTILSTNSFAYDVDGNRTNSTVWFHSNGVWVAAQTAYIYDGQNRVIQTIDPDGGTNIVVFDAAGRQQATIDKLGRTTQYAYDYLNRLVVTTYADGTTNDVSYDANGNRTASVDQLGRVTKYQFDALNRLTNTIYADNSTNLTAYDDLGRVKYTIDARGVTNAFAYDVANRRIAVTNGWGIPNLFQTNGFTFDSNGNQTAVKDNLGNKTSYFYDSLNRQTNVTYADNSTVFTVYDSVGRRIWQTNQDNIITRFAYDGVGRLLAVTNGIYSGQSASAQYQYDEAGNEIAQTDALGRTTTFVYDAMGHRTKRSLPGAQSETFAYDLAGNILSHTDFNGLQITNQYDSLNRLSNRWNAATLLESYSYTPSGQITNRTDSTGKFTWVYDLRDRVMTNITPTGTLYYGYDLNGNQTNLSSATSSGVSLTYQYDLLNRLTNVVDNRLSGSSNTVYTFDGVGNLKTLSYPNAITNLYSYDALNRLTSSTWKYKGTQRADFTYTLKASGTRTSLADNVNGSSRTFNWYYDGLYRLTNETVSGATIGTLTNFYDAVGNRTNRGGTLGGLSGVTNSFDVNDRLDNDANPNNANAWFDANGNMRTNGSAIYGYDWANRLTAYTNGSSTVSITYDAAGNRVKKTTSTTTTVYLVATVNPTGYPQVVEESTVSGSTTNLSKVYSHGLALISQRQISGNVVTFYGYDGLGSVRFLTDTSGTIQNTYAYDAFGTAVVSNAPIANVYLFAGEQWDPDISLSYNRARYWSPGTARFVTLDTFEGHMEDPLSLHKYLYCADNPVNRLDPSGNDGDVLFTGVGDVGDIDFLPTPGFSIGDPLRGSGWRVAFILDQFGTYRELYSGEAAELNSLRGRISDAQLIKLRGLLKDKYQRITPPEVERALKAAVGAKYDKRVPTGNFNPGATDQTINAAAKASKYAGRVFVVVMVYTEYEKVKNSNNWQRQLGASGSGVLGAIGGGSLGAALLGGALGALELNPMTVAAGAVIGGGIGGATGYTLCSGGFDSLWDVFYADQQ